MKRPETAEQRGVRFWAKVDKNGPVPDYRPDLGPCWMWTAALYSNGYGCFTLTIGSLYTTRRAHRIAYEYRIGRIPDGLTLDHLCRIRSGVNPSHLEPVSVRENILRGTSFSARHAAVQHCPRGHPYYEANTTPRKTGRGCRACAVIHTAKWRNKKRISA